MCDSLTSSLALFEAAIRAKSTNLKSHLKTREKRNIETNNIFLHKYVS